MADDKTVIIVTGQVASGKTELLKRLKKSAEKEYRLSGFVSIGMSRKPEAKEPAESYMLSFVNGQTRLPWADRRKDRRGFEFSESSREAATETVRTEIDSGEVDACFLDEMGRLELVGSGFAELFRFVLASRCRIVVVAVKKSVLAEIVDAFGLEAPLVIDLDCTDMKQGLKEAKRWMAARDAEAIGAFAGIGGIVEVGLGSTLHAYRVPFTGHALAYLQNLLLITFGKTLRGRGLVRIAFISAMLKAFSPIGISFRPMMYIFLQGVCFAAPVRLFGWHLGSVLLGSVLMGWVTIAMSLAMSYVTFGQSIFDAFSGGIAAASAWLGVGDPSLTGVIGGAFVLKMLISILLGVSAYMGNMQPLLRRLHKKTAIHRRSAGSEGGRDTTAGSSISPAFSALLDLMRPRFMIMFLLSALLLLFFTNLSQSDFLSLVVRGLCISYVGFLATRRIDLGAVGRWLDRRTGLDFGKSLPIALGALDRTPGYTKTKSVDAGVKR